MRRSLALALALSLCGCRREVAPKRDPEASPVLPPTDLRLIARTSDLRTLGAIPELVVGRRLAPALAGGREAVLVLRGPGKHAAGVARRATDGALLFTAETPAVALDAEWARAELESAKKVPPAELHLDAMGALAPIEASSFSDAAPELLSELGALAENRERITGELLALGRGHATLSLQGILWTVPLEKAVPALSPKELASLPAGEIDAWTPLAKLVARVHPNADATAVGDLERVVERGASYASDNSCGLASAAFRLRVRDVDAARATLAGLARPPTGGRTNPWNRQGWVGVWMTEAPTGKSKHDDGIRHLAALKGNDLILMASEPEWWITFERKCPPIEALVAPMLSAGAPFEEAEIHAACGRAPVVFLRGPPYAVCVTAEGSTLRVRATRKVP